MLAHLPRLNVEEPESNGFHMVVSYQGRGPVRRFTMDEYYRDKKRLNSVPPPGCCDTFVIGAFTGKYEEEIGQLNPGYVEYVESVHNALEKLGENRAERGLQGGIRTYSCFRREEYGRVRMSSRGATILDSKALEKCDFGTLLAGAEQSGGTWKELLKILQMGKDLLVLPNYEKSERDFHERIRYAAALAHSKSRIFLVTGDERDLQRNIQLAGEFMINRKIQSLAA